MSDLHCSQDTQPFKKTACFTVVGTEDMVTIITKGGLLNLNVAHATRFQKEHIIGEERGGVYLKHELLNFMSMQNTSGINFRFLICSGSCFCVPLRGSHQRVNGSVCFWTCSICGFQERIGSTGGPGRAGPRVCNG